MILWKLRKNMQFLSFFLFFCLVTTKSTRFIVWASRIQLIRCIPFLFLFKSSKISVTMHFYESFNSRSYLNLSLAVNFCNSSKINPYLKILQCWVQAKNCHFRIEILKKLRRQNREFIVELWVHILLTWFMLQSEIFRLVDDSFIKFLSTKVFRHEDDRLYISTFYSRWRFKLLMMQFHSKFRKHCNQD